METSLSKEGYRLIWKIENYDFLHSERGECLKSTELNFDTMGPMHLELYPKGDLFDKEEGILLCLVTPNKQKNYSVDCEVKLFTKLGEFSLLKESSLKAPRWKFKIVDLRDDSSEMWTDFLSSTTLLMIKCQFEPNINMKEHNFTLDSKDLQTLSDDMEKMCCNSQVSDLTLEFQKTKFQLHKAILHARVPKLAEELKIDDHSEVVMNFTSPSTLTSDIIKCFLVYVYCGKLPVLSTEVVRGLTYLSERYEMSCLKRKLGLCSTESVVYTIFQVDRKSFNWSLKDLVKSGLNEYFYGPVFTSGVVPFSDLHFVGFLEEDSYGDHDLRICVRRLFPENKVYLFMKCQVTVLNFTGIEKYKYFGEHFFKDDMEWKLPSFFRMKRVSESKSMYRLPNGHNLCLKGTDLLLKVEFCISGKEFLTQVVSTGCYITKESIPSNKLISEFSCIEKKLSSDLGKLYNIFLPKKSDVTLHIGDVRFPGHKVILTARSPVFCCMFETEMQEKEQKAVHIEDIDVATLNLMLMYMYSGKIDMILNFENAIKLYAASDKYDVAALKVKCAAILKDKLADDNACNLLAFADMHCDKELKNFVKEHIRQNSNILQLQGFKDLLETKSDLATEVIQMLMSVILKNEELLNRTNKEQPS